MKGLEGKVAIVTGGASGIGAAACRRFVAEGCRVSIGDINAAPVMGTWSCDSDEAVAAFDLRS